MRPPVLENIVVPDPDANDVLFVQAVPPATLPPWLALASVQLGDADLPLGGSILPPGIIKLMGAFPLES